MSNQSSSQARRAFIRTHHPDRGGATDVFLAGLAALDEACAHPSAGSSGRAVPDGGAPGRVVVTAYRARGVRGMVRRRLTRRRRARAGTSRVA